MSQSADFGSPNYPVAVSSRRLLLTSRRGFQARAPEERLNFLREAIAHLRRLAKIDVSREHSKTPSVPRPRVDGADRLQFLGEVLREFLQRARPVWLSREPVAIEIDATGKERRFRAQLGGAFKL